MMRVYIAGAYSADNVLGVLDNIRKGMRAGVEVLLAGHAPFVPWFDHHFVFMLQEGEKLTVPDFYAYSMAWLEVADIVLVLPGFENSKGTLAEITRAKELLIPVVYSMGELNNVAKAFELSKKAVRVFGEIVDGVECVPRMAPRDNTRRKDPVVREPPCPTIQRDGGNGTC
ncbi:Uncharacterised protein [uncultured archaeon]|nr:Uncharacterised protein [uncultured archaeon]